MRDGLILHFYLQPAIRSISIISGIVEIIIMLSHFLDQTSNSCSLLFIISIMKNDEEKVDGNGLPNYEQ